MVEITNLVVKITVVYNIYLFMLMIGLSYDYVISIVGLCRSRKLISAVTMGTRPKAY